MTERKATVKRETKETTISVFVDIDGNGKDEMRTGVRLFDHMLSQIARHGVFDIKVSATGDDVHHLVEDVGIALGKAFNEALGDKKGLVRIADATVPMDETLAAVAVDLGGRGYSVLNMEFENNDLAGFPADMVRHFLESFAAEGRLNLHAGVAYGTNDHHKVEAVFKALGRALDKATRIDHRIADRVPSTKEWVE
ncbi:imidazoleglycerol-phosphate dehydratase HisB [Dehalogenimonas alkenigignens]|uniref:Imidazoleglycerol-phosphate dehydratase n=1 Tax=Dehalogenimonas alkenigignens TaxID=1217799 RepID=A0A0W0GJE1_9CHLR|nr:imidazoleglycerol-phosphate dehydratase HisB [Dehalogenimonas alkenigignens]KTB48694.1 imidazoleglycerol-phosphate dehydratase [Dehalogenimonas alkenigignens]PVV84888.1 imidazoleglycerol-phosphate dehydratase HisB [Dehalogenimonas alkenigignens]